MVWCWRSWFSLLRVSAALSDLMILLNWAMIEKFRSIFIFCVQPLNMCVYVITDWWLFIPSSAGAKVAAGQQQKKLSRKHSPPLFPFSALFHLWSLRVRYYKSTYQICEQHGLPAVHGGYSFFVNIAVLSRKTITANQQWIMPRAKNGEAGLDRIRSWFMRYQNEIIYVYRGKVWICKCGQYQQMKTNIKN